MRRSSLRPRAAPPVTTAQAEAGGAQTAARAARRARAAERAREVEEPAQVVRDKVRRLADAVLAARHLVVYTGAGVSTAARIPDYRGPRGVWTGLARGRPPPRVDVAAATPTLTHMALAALWRAGALRFLVSQNCDGLHLRSGVPRRALAELHGDMFVESCGACDLPHLRRFDTTERTSRHRHRTRRLCRACGHELRDTIVHFGERGRAKWPLNWRGAVSHARRADVILVLGSSLKVLRRYPRLWPRRRRPRLFIVNLQWTPKDAAAELKISARCDDVMRLLLRELGVRVPAYSPRRDPLFAHCTPLLPRERHTTRRRTLPSPSSSSSPSPDTSDSEDNTPLREIADDLRLKDSQALCSFEVQLCTGPATILLHSRHAPSARRALRPPPPLLPLHNGTKLAACDLPLKAISKLRQFRRVKPSANANGYVNGHAVKPERRQAADEQALNGIKDESRLLGTKDELKGTKHEPGFIQTKNEPVLFVPKNEPVLLGIKSEGGLFGTNDEEHVIKTKNETEFFGSKNESGLMEPKHNLIGIKKESQQIEPKWQEVNEKSDQREANGHSDVIEMKRKAEQSDEGMMRECVSLARAIIAHALIVCREQLYPGLHNIIPPPPPAPPAPPPPPAQCHWCFTQLASKRCLFYLRAGGDGVPRAADGRWCACCEPGGGDAGDARPDGDADAGGWYGKGYAKIRRKRR